MLWSWRRVFRIVLPVLMLLQAPWSGAVAEPQSNLVVILDASGSMWGKAGPETKIVAAKQVLSEVLKGVSPDVAVGFVAYGHRRKGDCTDIEMIAPLGSDPAAIATRAQKLVPRGRTPITEAMRQAATLFGAYDRPSTMVLVSDGIETCKGDPCALAKELKAQGVDLVIHTVGFGVAAKAARQLQCIAKAGDGNYYQAKDRPALSKALLAVRAAVTKNQPAPKPKVPEPVKTTTKKRLIIGPGTIKLKLASWIKKPPYQWRAVDPETGEKKGAVSGPTKMKIRKGEYQIVWRQTKYATGDIALSTIVDVSAGKIVEVPIDTGLQIKVPQGIKAPYQWSLTRPDEKKPLVMVSETLDPQVVPEGRYVLHWRQDKYNSPTVGFGMVEIAASKLNQVVLGSGVRFKAADWVPGEPYYISLVSAGGKELGQWNSKAALQPQLVGPGKYQAFYRQSKYSHTDIPLGEIVVPERGFAEVLVNSGVKFKPQEGVKPPYKAIFVPLGGGKEYVWDGESYGKWAPVPLPPGHYRLDWWEDKYKSERMTLVDEFEIEPGTLVEFEM